MSTWNSVTPVNEDKDLTIPNYNSYSHLKTVYKKEVDNLTPSKKEEITRYAT